METIDYLIVIGGGLMGNVVFNNFEKHLPLWRRVGKFAAVMAILALAGAAFGRYAFYGVLILLTAAQVVLHAWWFPRHGINGLTAEPYDRYLELIRRMKGGGK